MRLLFDCEADNLFDKVENLWLVGVTDIDTSERVIYMPGDMDWRKHLAEAEWLIGHNILDYDLAVFKKLFKYRLPESVKLVDTLLYSQILDYRRFGMKGHSMKVWGEHLSEKYGENYNKIEFTDFSKFTPEMVPYLHGDLDLNLLIYRELMAEYRELLKKAPKLAIYIKAEHAAAEWVADAKVDGWPFDVEGAVKIEQELNLKVQSTVELLQPKLGMKCVAVDKEKGVVEPKMPAWIKNGQYASRTASWFDIDPRDGLEDGLRQIEGPYSRVKFEHRSLSSVDDVKEFLFKQGWEPTEWNFKFLEDGTKVKTSPKITEDSLEFLEQDGKLYLEYLTLRSRHSIVKTWLENITPQGTLHGDCMLIGTPSMRSRHSIIVNVPTGDSVYGKEMRSLFKCREGWTLIGADSASNQARGLAHDLKSQEYTNKLLNEDIHVYNADKLTESLKQMGVNHTVPRSVAKRILYAFLFGASGGKLWGYIFGQQNVVKGNKLKKLFMSAVPGFADLIANLEKIFGATKRNGYGYVPSIVGNRIYVDSFHKLLVYRLQSSEKITCALALMLTVKGLKEAGIPYSPKIFYHDEIDFEVPIEHAQQAAEIAKKAFKEGPRLVGIEIMDGEAKIGKTWYEVH